MSLKRKLEIYRQKLHEAQQPAAFTHTASRHDALESAAKLEMAARQLEASIRQFGDQYVLVHHEHIPLGRCVGSCELGSLPQAVALWQNGMKAHPLSAHGLAANDLLFFDTETTGLSSGAGQMIFLIGLARFTAAGFELRQYFLPGPGHEVAFYNAFLHEAASLKNLVTFNGKAFDWPRVKTRYQFVRDRVPLLPAFGHFDLLHASRRLWADRLESVGLQAVEQHILGWKRDDDVPGKMAPFLYFQFLKRPDAQLIAGILQHNREDVLSLIALYILLSFKLNGQAAVDCKEAYAIARWCDQLGARSRAEPLFRSLADGVSPESARAKAILFRYAKRDGDYAAALRFLNEIIQAGAADADTYIEAAKLLEHQLNDSMLAALYTEKALDKLNSYHAETSGQASRRRDCLYRLDRLHRKIKRVPIY
ncbi:MAG: ribonuclease H-like domain-containing protein [Sporolactobacillus sp.]